MKMIYTSTLQNFAKYLPAPLYVVGGYTRNFLIDGSLSSDIDVCSTLSVEDILLALEKFGGKAVATYKRTGTVVFVLDGQKYEYTTFRKDGYSAGGKHVPDQVEFTKDIVEDALRRDFKCNAVYYDLKNDVFVDPLGGIQDIKNKILDTVKAPKEVFSHDGLRLMRLARFCGELGFSPTEQVIDGARAFADNISDVSVERIWAELKYILSADTKHQFSPKDGHYRALRILDQTRVLDKILPDLAKGRGLEQRKDFHDYDVLEHSLRCVLYAPKKVRICALLHDEAKPLLMVQNGNAYGHEKVGASMAKEFLKRIKADSETIEKTSRIIRAHMLDMKGDMKESKVRAFMLENVDILEGILQLKQADFSACKDDLSVCPTVMKWREIYQKMLADGTPFSIADLKVNATDVMSAGYTGKDIGKTLNDLLKLCQAYPEKNQREYLLGKIIAYKK